MLGPLEKWQENRVESAIPQSDFQEGKTCSRARENYDKVRTLFEGRFAQGPKMWTSHEPNREDEVELEFDIAGTLDSVGGIGWMDLSRLGKPRSS